MRICIAQKLFGIKQDFAELQHVFIRNWILAEFLEGFSRNHPNQEIQAIHAAFRIAVLKPATILLEAHARVLQG